MFVKGTESFNILKNNTPIFCSCRDWKQFKALDSGFTDNICGVFKFPILMAFHALKNYFYSKISLCKLESDKGPGIH